MMYVQLAWRYATRRRVNFIAIAALALALAVQIVAMAILDGMLVDLEKRLRNMGEQITLRVTGDVPDRAEYDRAVAEIIRTVPGVRAVTPLVQKVGFLEAGGGRNTSGSRASTWRRSWPTVRLRNTFFPTGPIPPIRPGMRPATGPACSWANSSPAASASFQAATWNCFTPIAAPTGTLKRVRGVSG